MTPAFSPEPTGLPMIPITIAAVGEAMLRVAGQSADGVRLHPLCSRRYLEQICLPQIAEGMARAGRAREHFDVHGGGFVVTGPDQAAVAAASVRVRERIAFYGSTRTYLPILALHGLEDLGQKLHAMSVRGRWQDMAAEISEDVLHIFAACAPYDGLGRRDRGSFRWRCGLHRPEFPCRRPARAATRAARRHPPHPASFHRLRYELAAPMTVRYCTPRPVPTNPKRSP